MMTQTLVSCTVGTHPAPSPRSQQWAVAPSSYSKIPGVEAYVGHNYSTVPGSETGSPEHHLKSPPEAVDSSCLTSAVASLNNSSAH